MLPYIPPVPLIQMQESTNFTNLCQANIPNIISNWGSIINDACAAYNVDSNIILGFVAIESPDLIEDAVSSAGAIGLIQMQPPTAFDFLCQQAASNNMPADYATVVNYYMPGFLKPGGFTGFWSTWKAAITAALAHSDFNLWTGITGIAQMIWKDMKTNNGTVRLDHIVIKYNAGGDETRGNYHKYVITPGLQNADPTTLLNSLPETIVETKAYMIKLLGIQGSIVTAVNINGAQPVATPPPAQPVSSLVPGTDSLGVYDPNTGLTSYPSS